MIKPIFAPLESLEAEEDNEPPSFDNWHDLFACPCFFMDFPAIGLKSKSKHIRQHPFYSAIDFTANTGQGQSCHIAFGGPAGSVGTFFPDGFFSGLPQC